LLQQEQSNERMDRRPQFGMRENPASDRRHGSRPVVSTKSNSNFIEKENSESLHARPHAEMPFHNAHTSAHQPTIVADHANSGQLLTVQEVAELLRVPVSWVYGRTRKRSLERLPGYRLGKYWRFREDEIRAWIGRHCGANHSA